MEAFIVYGRNDTRKRKNRKGNKTSKYYRSSQVPLLCLNKVILIAEMLKKIF